MVHTSTLIILANKCAGEPKLTDFELKEEVLEELKDGEFIAEAIYFGINAGLRAYSDYLKIGQVVVGGQVARVIESKSTDFPVCSIVYGVFGWRTLTLVQPGKYTQSHLYVLPDFGGLPSSLATGYLGMCGNTAYFGLLEICKPKEGETVVVTAAAGSVGSLAGQIAKIKGCRVIGFAGSDDKCRWLEDELDFDKAINYKSGDMAKALKEAAPNGVDCYFDNVGGELSSIIVHQMNTYGRVASCGAVSEYNAEDVKVTSLYKTIISKQLTVEGFVVYRWVDRWFEGIQQIIQWIHEGKVQYRESFSEGFENMPQAFIDVLRGANVGKAVLKV